MAAHNRSGYVRGCRCDVCTKANRDYTRGYLRESRARAQAARPPKVCPGCGCEFTTHGKRRWCSDGCKSRTEARRAARRQRGGKGIRRIALERALDRAARGTSSTWRWISGTCIECGESFTRHGAASPFCSKACSSRTKRRARRALERGIKVTPIRRFRIHERDGWTCHICGDLVDREAVVPDPAAPTLDHVVALARGGAHDEANLRTAHFYCNSVKRDLDLSVVA